MVDMLAAESHIDYWIANRLEVEDGHLTGKVLGEIVCKTVKLHALQTWADRLGIPMSQTVAVGDGANDIPMIQAAGLGVGVQNTIKDMKPLCGYITEATNDEGAVAEVIEKFILQAKQ